MSNKQVGEVDALPGVYDKKNFHVFCMKEPAYTMMLMSTYGGLQEVPSSNANRVWQDDNGVTQRKRFKYTEPFHNHYAYRNCVDNHNNRRQGTISVEDSFAARNWSFRVFTFLVSLTETNAALSYWYFTQQQEDHCPQQLDIRQELALQMLGNNLAGEENGMATRRASKGVQSEHQLVNPPRYTGKWLGDKWKKVKSEYLARSCSRCKGDTRKYCKCTTGLFLCVNCFPDHVLECGHT